MSKRGQAVKLANGLTPKQDKFTKVILQQIAETGTPNATEAAAQVYDTKDRGVAGSIAVENLQKPIIKQTIEEALASSGVATSEIVQNIKKIAIREPDKVTAETVLKSNIELLKLLGAYPSHNKAPNGNTINQKILNISFGEAEETIKRVANEAHTFLSETGD